LKESVDRGERGLLWYWLDHDPNLDSIRGEPAFHAIREQLRQEAAGQLVQIRNGKS
jgi:hypothetical protein